MNSRKLICAALSALLIWTGIFGTAAEVRAEKAESAAETLSGGPAASESAEGAEPAASPDWFEDRGMTLGESSLCYPQLREGVLEEELRARVNGRIQEDGGIQALSVRMSQLISGGRMRVSWRGAVLGPVFSFQINAEGALYTSLPAYARTGGSIDLRDGHEVTLQELFPDPEAALEWMERYMEEEAAPELNGYLANSQVTPLPERFRMTEQGLVWMYAADQLSTLSDRAGEILIPWAALRDQLDLSPEGLPAAMGVAGCLTGGEALTEEECLAAAERIRAAVDGGRIPGIPAALGDGVSALTEEWDLLTDPDVYIHGRLFALEGAEFRNVFLMTDYLSESWDHSQVDGIRMDQGSLCGLAVGRTDRETWQRVLGAPDHTVEMDAETAEAYRTVTGPRDYYVFEHHRLQLQADEDGTLVSIVLSV